MPALWDRQEVQAGSAVSLRQRSMLSKVDMWHGVIGLGTNKQTKKQKTLLLIQLSVKD